MRWRLTGRRSGFKCYPCYDLVLSKSEVGWRVRADDISTNTIITTTANIYQALILLLGSVLNSSHGLSNLIINPATTEDQGTIRTLFYKWENLRWEELGNLSEVTEEAEPGSELRQVDSGVYMISYYIMKPPFTLECLSKEKLGLSLPDPIRYHEESLSRILRSLTGQKAEKQAKYPERLPAGSLQRINPQAWNFSHSSYQERLGSKLWSKV